MIWGLVTFVFNEETHSPDSPLAFMPNMTIVLFIYGVKTQICAWKEQDPHCHVDPGTPARL
ncbi:MAG: hypothetical protein ACR2QW_06345 [bacterium]